MKNYKIFHGWQLRLPAAFCRVKPLAIREIISINLGDQVTFHLVGISPIMDELEYEGFRVGIETHLDKMITHLKIDVSTGDAITPQAITDNYGFMFEDRTIQIKAYPIETVLAEKIETMISRADTNTRMRDFYDMHILLKTHYDEIDNDSLRNALNATSRQRGTTDSLSGAELVLKTLENSPRWQNSGRNTRYSTAMQKASHGTLLRFPSGNCA